jgi:hypothetical protein
MIKISSIEQKKLIVKQLEQLLEEIKNDATIPYIETQMRRILGGSKWAYYLNTFDKIEPIFEKIQKFVYNVYLGLTGLSLKG